LEDQRMYQCNYPSPLEVKTNVFVLPMIDGLGKRADVQEAVIGPTSRAGESHDFSLNENAVKLITRPRWG